MPQSANRTDSASVDFPLPRAPMMQVRPGGILMLSPGRKPPLISIFSTTHISPGICPSRISLCFDWGLGSIPYCTPETGRFWVRTTPVDSMRHADGGGLCNDALIVYNC